MFADLVPNERVFHNKLAWFMIYLSPVAFTFLRWFPANYGKTFRTLLGPTVPARLGWCIMELPNLVWAGVCYAQAMESLPLANYLLLAFFLGHYINRTFLYPLTLNPHSQPLPLEICLSAFAYTFINGYVQCRALCQFITYPPHHTSSPLFIIGTMVFLSGIAINGQSDRILRNLRKSTKDYVIPHGGLFRYVSNPHYLGELMEWTGFAMAGQSAAAWSFAVFTAANLIPRALAHHQWYLDKFGDKYPRDRTAILPFLW